MPKLDGISACQKIRNFERSSSTAETPIIGMTGDKDNLDFSLAGANIIVEKPIKQVQLVSFLNAMIK